MSVRGYIFVILAACAWAIMGTLAKHLFQAGVSPEALVQVRTTLSALILAAGLRVARPELLRSKDWMRLIGLGVVTQALNYFCYFKSISLIPVGVAILLEFTAPIFLVLYSALILRARVESRTLISLGLSMAGLLLILQIGQKISQSMDLSGILFGFGAAITFAIYLQLGAKLVARNSPWTVMLYASLGASIVWSGIHPPAAFLSAEYSGNQWLSILAIVGVGTILAEWLFLQGLSLIGPAHAGITGTFQPVAAALMAFLFIDEVLTTPQIFGGVLVLGAIVVLKLRTSSPVPSVVSEEV